MCGRGRGRGNGKGSDASTSRPGCSRDALARQLEGVEERFQDVMLEVERRGDNMEAALTRIEQKVELLIDQHEELLQRAFALEHHSPGRRHHPWL